MTDPNFGNTYNAPGVSASIVASQTVVGAQPRSWLEFQADEYRENYRQWCYARDHYEGQVLRDDKVTQYLVRKATAEDEHAYLERCQLADYTPHFGTVVDTLAGMMFRVDDEATRVFGTKDQPGLGDPTDPATPIGRLFRDADGKGNGWLTLFKQIAIELTVIHTTWGLVDVVDGQVVSRYLKSEDVVNWRYGPHGLLDVVVREYADTRTSIEDDPNPGDQYVHFTLNGWQRYSTDPKGQPIRGTGPGASGTYKYTDAYGNPQLPIFRVELPLRRHVGYLLAKKANAIFNRESERDHILRFANFPKLNLVATDDEFPGYTDRIAKGANVLQDNPVHNRAHAFIAPSAESAKVATDVIKEKVVAFFINAFHEYGDSAIQKTATEVRQTVAAGPGAFLQMLKSALDDAENQMLWRVERATFPKDPARWNLARVERSSDFAPLNVEEVIARQQARYFGQNKSVPMSREGQAAIAQQVATFDGVETDDDDVLAAVDMQALINAAPLLPLVTLPAKVRAVLGAKLALGLGAITAAEVAATQAEGETLALAEDQTKRRASELFAPTAPASAAGGDGTGVASTDGASPGTPTTVTPGSRAIASLPA